MPQVLNDDGYRLLGKWSTWCSQVACCKGTALSDSGFLRVSVCFTTHKQPTRTVPANLSRKLVTNGTVHIYFVDIVVHNAYSTSLVYNAVLDFETFVSVVKHHFWTLRRVCVLGSLWSHHSLYDDFPPIQRQVLLKSANRHRLRHVVCPRYHSTKSRS